MVVEDIGYRHENVEFGFRIKQELLEDEKEMLKNTSEIRKIDRARCHASEKLKKENCVR